MRFFSLLSALCLSSAAFAQDAFSPEETEACLAGLDRKTDRRVCVGASARSCSHEQDDAICMAAEITYWDTRLKVAYALVLDRSKGKDDDAHHLNLQPRDQAGALATAQDSWHTYRADTCAFEQTLWGSGQADAPEVQTCHLYLTAEQVFYLEAVALIE
ncbi:lysozyme inhibitor LprI family protein [Shimia sp. Alg240-R146]|uniref:lysozyme inhibitor LprI family protein n=1 Tax=Shimia sp. Alg240-R146 TaxID=2993449 RepID=UPI0022E4C96B|nr:lysozyme inhibitor LprI family protein [Shimia sp. Alg240-R146]